LFNAVVRFFPRGKSMTRDSKISPPTSARLFSDSHSPPAGVHIANIDGASRGNPGPASYAVVIRDPSGKVILELAKKFGRDTNNVAEYYALLAALDYTTTHGITALRIRSDSELLVRQMQGRYKVKSPDLKPLHERASRLSKQLAYFAIEHVRREENCDADALANLALDSGPVWSATPSQAREKPRSKTPESPAVGPVEVRARFANGVFVPLDQVNLAEGVEVIVQLPKSKQE
jgi:ribonuclease HI